MYHILTQVVYNTVCVVYITLPNKYDLYIAFILYLSITTYHHEHMNYKYKLK